MFQDALGRLCGSTSCAIRSLLLVLFVMHEEGLLPKVKVQRVVPFCWPLAPRRTREHALELLSVMYTAWSRFDNMVDSPHKLIRIARRSLSRVCTTWPRLDKVVDTVVHSNPLLPLHSENFSGRSGLRLGFGFRLEVYVNMMAMKHVFSWVGTAALALGTYSA